LSCLHLSLAQFNLATIPAEGLDLKHEWVPSKVNLEVVAESIVA